MTKVKTDSTDIASNIKATGIGAFGLPLGQAAKMSAALIDWGECGSSGGVDGVQVELNEDRGNGRV